MFDSGASGVFGPTGPTGPLEPTSLSLTTCDSAKSGRGPTDGPGFDGGSRSQARHDEPDDEPALPSYAQLGNQNLLISKALVQGFVTNSTARTLASINMSVATLKDRHDAAAGSSRPAGSRHAGRRSADDGDGRPQPGEPRRQSAESVEKMLLFALTECPRLLPLLEPLLDDEQLDRVREYWVKTTELR
jgi:hypothetical protein